MAIVLPAGASLRAAERADPRRSRAAAAARKANRSIRPGSTRCRIPRSSRSGPSTIARDGSYRGARARNWTRIGDRMNCIVNVFRARQAKDVLYTVEPLTSEELESAEAALVARRAHDATAVHGRTSRRDARVRRPRCRRRSSRTSRASPVSTIRATSCSGSSSINATLAARRAGSRRCTRTSRGHAALPAWADEDTLRRGQRFFSVFGVHIASALFCALATDELHRRRRRAGPHAHDGTRLRHAPPPGADGRDVARRHGRERRGRRRARSAPDTHSFRAPHGVRLFHAAVRHMLRNDPNYDRDALGEPINQEDQLGTLLAFTVVVIDALERFGVDVSDADRDAYVQLWFTAGSYPRHRSGAPAHAAGPTTRSPLQWDEMLELRDTIAPSQRGSQRVRTVADARAPRRGVGVAPVPLARIAAGVHAVTSSAMSTAPTWTCRGRDGRASCSSRCRS